MRNGKLHFLCSVSCPQISAFSRNPGIQNYRKWKIWFWWYGKKTFSTLNFFSQKFFLDLFSISQWNWKKIAQFIQRKFCKSFYNQGKLKQNKMENLVLIISFFFMWHRFTHMRHDWEYLFFFEEHFRSTIGNKTFCEYSMFRTLLC